MAPRGACGRSRSPILGAVPELLFLLLASRPLAARARVFSVRDFGAVGDGVTKDTAAVRAAAAALQAAGGGVLSFPALGTYLTGAFNLSSHAVVRIDPDATVLGSPDGADWPLLEAARVWPQFGHGSDCPVDQESCRLMHQALIFAWSAENISLEGGGTLDCNAGPSTWWACARDLSQAPCSGYARPHCLMVSGASTVSVSDVTVRNSPDWTLHFSSVTGLRISRVNISNPESAPNSDGIDIDCSQDVIIEDCRISVGDDAIAIKSGIDYFGRLYNRPSRDIIFRRNWVGSAHGISVGSETSGSITNVTFEDCLLEGSNEGIKVKSMRGRGGVVSDITYRNITMRQIRSQCVQLTMNFQPAQPTNASATPTFRDILLQDINCESAVQGFLIDGLAESPIQGLRLVNVTLGSVPSRQGACDNVDCTCDAATNVCPTCCQREDLADTGRETDAESIMQLV